MRKWLIAHLWAFAVCAFGCAPAELVDKPKELQAGSDSPLRSIKSVGEITIGEPLALTTDFDGNVLVADGSPGRVIRIDADNNGALEFQRPTTQSGFYPADVKFSGFFVYVLDTVGRTLLRFDRHGAYRDQLINFDQAFDEGSVYPSGLDVDPSGRIAVCDAQNHSIILFNSFLEVELVFGNYGSYHGQLNAPEGVSFAANGDLVVADTGNRRIQRLDSGGGFLSAIPDGNGENPLREPRRVAIGEDGAIWVADPGAGRVFVFDDNGVLLRSIAPSEASEFTPTDVAIVKPGLIYVADAASSSILVFR